MQKKLTLHIKVTVRFFKIQMWNILGELQKKQTTIDSWLNYFHALLGHHLVMP